MKTIQVRRTRHAGLCWRSRDELISDLLLWTPTYGRAKAGRPSRTYIRQLCEDTGCSLEDLPEAMNDWEKWRERVSDISACGTTWWWWYIYDIYIYIYIYIYATAYKFFHQTISREEEPVWKRLILCLKWQSILRKWCYKMYPKLHFGDWISCKTLFRRANAIGSHGIYIYIYIYWVMLKIF